MPPLSLTCSNCNIADTIGTETETVGFISGDEPAAFDGSGYSGHHQL